MHGKAGYVATEDEKPRDTCEEVRPPSRGPEVEEKGKIDRVRSGENG